MDLAVRTERPTAEMIPELRDVLAISEPRIAECHDYDNGPDSGGFVRQPTARCAPVGDFRRIGAATLSRWPVRTTGLRRDAADARDGTADCAWSTAQQSAVAGDATGRGHAPYRPSCGHRFGVGCGAIRAGIPIRCKCSRWLDAGCGSCIPVRQRDGGGVFAGASGRTHKSDGSLARRVKSEPLREFANAIGSILHREPEGDET